MGFSNEDIRVLWRRYPPLGAILSGAAAGGAEIQGALGGPCTVPCLLSWHSTPERNTQL